MVRFLKYIYDNIYFIEYKEYSIDTNFVAKLCPLPNSPLDYTFFLYPLYMQNFKKIKD